MTIREQSAQMTVMTKGNSKLPNKPRKPAVETKMPEKAMNLTLLRQNGCLIAPEWMPWIFFRAINPDRQERHDKFKYFYH